MTKKHTPTSSKLSEWTYQGRPVSDEDTKGMAGFIYKITDTTNNYFYIGRKYLTSCRKPKGKTRRVTSESDWRKYCSSSDVVKAIAKERPETLIREILSFHPGKGEVNYMETRTLFEYEALERPDCYNDNIAGRWFATNVRKYECGKR